MCFLQLEMTTTGFGLVHTFRVFFTCRVRLPTWLLSLTSNGDNQFWLVLYTTLQYLNFYHSVISIFDCRRRSVNFDSTIENRMEIETSMTSQVGKNSRPYFPCVHHRLVPGKHPQRHWHNSKLISWYWQLGYISDTGMVSVFFWIFWFLYQGHTFTENRQNTRHRQQIRFVPLVLGSQITWRSIWLHKNREIVGKWAVGLWERIDTWLKAPIGVLEPNTNAQRMSLISHLLRSFWNSSAQNYYRMLRPIRKFPFYPWNRTEHWNSQFFPDYTIL